MQYYVRTKDANSHTQSCFLNPRYKIKRWSTIYIAVELLMV